MSTPNWIEKYTERSSRSIFARFLTPQEMAAFWTDSSIGHELKFTAALAAFAHLKFPLRLSDFRQAVPDEFWRQHCSISWVGFSTGFIPIYFGEGEWFYTLRFAQSHKMRNAYAVY